MAKPDHVATVRRIAAVLGISVDSLLDPSVGPSEPGGATELLALWDRITTGADRARLLALARAMAAGDDPTEPA